MWVSYGKIYMKSGSVIPFAASKLDWAVNLDGLSRLEYRFHKVDVLGIPLLSCIVVAQIEAIVLEGTHEIEGNEDDA